MCKNQASQKYVVRKSRDILVDFSEKCGDSSLILYQELASGSFFKISCSVGSESMSINLYSVTLKSNGHCIHFLGLL